MNKRDRERERVGETRGNMTLVQRGRREKERKAKQQERNLNDKRVREENDATEVGIIMISEM